MTSGGWTQGRRAMVGVAGVLAGMVLGGAVVYGGPVLGLLAAAGLIAGGRALYPRIRRAFDEQDRRQQELRSRAEQQHRWASRGDPRGVYGTAGAQAMRSLSAAPTEPPAAPPGADLEVATVVHTDAELQTMLADKPPCWRYAAFVSIMVQRRAAVAARLRDARMGFSDHTGESVPTGFEAGLFFSDRLADLGEFVDEVNAFMLSPAFQEVFGLREESADVDGIVHAANRLMDYHDRALALCERCRAVRVPPSCRDLQHDFGLLTALPLESFTTFVEQFTDRIAEAADVARYATGDVQLDPVEFGITDDDDILGRVSRRIQEITRRA